MTPVQTSDVLPVRSRVAWSAIFAGTFVAIAMCVLLGWLGVALGISVSDQAEGQTLGIAAGIWMAVTLLLSLFLGGFVASRCTVGENTTEAVFYGALVWGGVLTFMGLFAATGAITGAAALAGANQAASAAERLNVGLPAGMDQDLRGLGLSLTPEQRMATMEQKFKGQGITLTTEQRRQLKAWADDPAAAARAVAADSRTVQAAWWTFAGLALSIGAAVGGAVVGAGPNLIITSFRVRGFGVATTEAPAREQVNR